jgi:hypothetical protein
MSEVKTFFKDKIVQKPSFEIKPTLGSDPGVPGNTTGSPAGNVSPKELPSNTLKHGK